MNNFKNITYTLLTIISLSLVSVAAQADGISITIGYNSHDNDYRPSTYYGHHRPVVTHSHQHKPYYGYSYNRYYRDRGYRKYGHHEQYSHYTGYQKKHYRSHGKHYNSGHGSRHHNKHNYRHSRHGYSRLASNRSHRY